jgi:hypothetical protein
MRRKFVTSKSVTKSTTYGIYDPKAGEESVQQQKTVRVNPSSRTVQDSGGLFGRLKRRKKQNPTEKAEEFARVLER